MPSPTTPILDDFNRADAATLGANWGDDPFSAGRTFRILSNTAATQAGFTVDSLYKAQSFGPDCEAYVTITNLPTGKGGHILARSTAGSSVSCYSVSPLQGTGVRTYKWVAGTPTQLGSTVANAPAVGDSFGICCIGSTIETWYQVGAGAWTLLASATDSAVTDAGFLGLHAEADIAYDNFGGGNVTNAVLSAKPRFIYLRKNR